MGKKLELQMAKASTEDFDRVIEFFRVVEEFMEYETVTEEHEDGTENVIRLSDEEFVELIRKLWGRRFGPPGVDCSWSRVVFGCQMLIENACDPNSNVLAWKPEISRLQTVMNEATKFWARYRCINEAAQDDMEEETEAMIKKMSECCDECKVEANKAGSNE